MNNGFEPIGNNDLMDGEGADVVSASLRSFELHPSHIEIGPNGVSNFHLPIDESDADRFCETFMIQLVDALRSRDIDRDRTAEALWLALVWIVFECTSLFYLTRICRRYREAGYRATWGGPDSAIAKIGSGEAPSGATLRMVLVTPNLSRIQSPWVRWLGSLNRRDGYSRRPPYLLERNRDALCLVGEPAARAMAESDGKRLVLGRYEHWIDFGTGWQSRLPEATNGDAIKDVIQIAEQTFLSAREPMPLHVRSYLQECVEVLAGVALKSLGDIESKARYLPLTFLSGSTASIHNRAIGRVVQKEGGTFTTFDHGVGGGWRNIPSATITVWDQPNRFVTFSQTHADGIKSVMNPDLRVCGFDCDVVASPIPMIPQTRVETRKSNNRAGKKRIMYVSTLYFGERYYSPRMPLDFAELDFQVRLLSHLKTLGYDITIKHHPECVSGMRDDVAAFGDAVIETRRFEDIAGDADILLFDCPSSTTFRSAVCTDIPIVVVDHGLVPIIDHALSLIEQRAAIVRTRRGENNRIDLDWSDLDHAIVEAPELRSPAFANLYFGADI